MQDMPLASSRPQTWNSVQPPTEEQTARLSHADNVSDTDGGLAPEQMMLKCGVSFKCQPDPRWKDIFRHTALEMKNAVELDRAYTERMSSYCGKQVSNARIQLNTPRDEPNKARALNSKPA